ncbi:hypothetical protein KEM55_004491, partial [Ascosphaera atra]
MAVKRQRQKKEAAPQGADTPSFEDIIQKARDRRKKQQFTTEFFERKRQRQQGAANAPKATLLEGRISKPGATNTASNVNGNITTTFVPRGPTPRGPKSQDPRRLRKQQQRLQRAAAPQPVLQPQPQLQQPQPQIVQPQQIQLQPRASFNIRGAASGPCTVIGSNFAPGTTAADIQSAFEPEGGPMLSCALLSTFPMVTAEMVFAERSGAEAVVAKFNNQKADGRILHIRINPTPVYSAPTAAVPTAPAAMISPYEDMRQQADWKRRERQRRSQ